MKMADFKLGELVLIKYTNFINILAICWPTNQIEYSQVALSKIQLDLNGIQVENSSKFHLYKMDKSKCYQAIEIIIEAVGDSCSFLYEKNDDSEELEKEAKLIMQFLKEIYTNKYILEDQLVNLVYMGKQLIFKVMSVVKSKKKNKANNSIGIDFLTERLENSSLNEKKYIKFK